MDKLDGILEDREESRQTEVGHFLHHWVRIHLETPATSSPVVYMTSPQAACMWYVGLTQ